MRALTIRIVTPAPRGSRSGNRVTARRWAALLRELGHRVRIETEYLGGGADVLVALHARKSHPSVLRFRERVPGGALVVALTGTDVYGDLGRSAAAGRSIELADRLIVLQPLAARALPPTARSKARVIFQSAVAPRFDRRPSPAGVPFRVCVVGHLRAVKDPFRAALAARRLPAGSTVEVTQIGGALSPAMERRARKEARDNPRYRWLGELARAETLRRLCRSRLLVLSSRREGGANVISEALAAGVPVLASRIPGSVGLLGPRYPGYFPVGDTAALAALLLRAERDEPFRARLAEACGKLRGRFEPREERASWARLLEELRAPR